MTHLPEAVRLDDSPPTLWPEAFDEDGPGSLAALFERLESRVGQRSPARPRSAGPGPRRAAKAADSTRRARPKHRVELVLYTSAASEKSRTALRAIREVLEQFDQSQIDFTVCDLAAAPSRADDDAIIFTPTLVKRWPGPRTWIVGNIAQPELLIDLLEGSGVDRRR